MLYSIRPPLVVIRPPSRAKIFKLTVTLELIAVAYLCFQNQFTTETARAIGVKVTKIAF